MPKALHLALSWHASAHATPAIILLAPVPCAEYLCILAASHQRLMPFLPMQRSEVSGCAVLPDTAAYLECSVLDQMEAGDHWVVYAEVTDGKVKLEGALSSVHHRKVGTTY